MPTVIDQHHGASQVDALYGSSVHLLDLDGDGRDEVVVGARDEDPGTGRRVGRVRIFRGGIPILNAVPWRVLDDPAGLAAAAGSEFGSSAAALDFNGDGLTDLAIGARGASAAGVSRAGKVIVFYGPDFAQTHTIFSRFPESGALFGHWIAAGDFDGDEREDLCIGAPEATSANLLPKVGIVEIHYGPGGAAVQRIDCPFPVSEADFGYRIAVADAEGDGFDDLAIAATTYPLGPCGIHRTTCADLTMRPPVDRSGRLFVLRGPSFEVIADFPNPLPSPSASGVCHQGLLGADLVFKDVDGDASPDVVVSAEWDTLSAYGQGSVWILYGGDFTRRQQILGPGPVEFAGFGSGVDVVDFDRDGHQDLAVGEFTRIGPAGTCQLGRVVALYGPSFTAFQEWYEPPPSGTQRQFGRRVRVGDVDGDGWPEIYVGAPQSRPPVPRGPRNAGGLFTIHR